MTRAVGSIATPIGEYTAVVEDGALVELWSPGGEHPRAEGPQDDATLALARRELAEYFAGKRRSFTVPLAARGTPFQLKVWDALRRIPHGRTASYGAIAAQVGTVSARAVGLANGANPIAVLIPCHRVIGANGKLTGYAGGLDVKARLLALERGEAPLL